MSPPRKRGRDKGWALVKHVVLTRRPSYLIDKRTGWLRGETQLHELRRYSRTLPGFVAIHWWYWNRAQK